jgi:hypothetical protein
MTPYEALERAETCARLASQMPDPMKRTLLEQMRQAWIDLAAEALKPGSDIAAESQELLEVETALFQRPNTAIANRLH